MKEDFLPASLIESIDATADKLLKRKFPGDPLFPGKLSKIASVVSSAYKRHGFILEQALLTRLAQNEQFDVWEDRKFCVSASAEQLVSTFFDHAEHADLSQLPYLPEPENCIRTIQVDLIVYDRSNKTLISYEVKRGNGQHDAGKKRNMRRDLMIQQTLLKSYGEQRGYDIAKVDSKMIFYYGQCSLPKPYAITGDELDDHFGFSVQTFVEAANEAFAEKIRASFFDAEELEGSENPKNENHTVEVSKPIQSSSKSVLEDTSKSAIWRRIFRK